MTDALELLDAAIKAGEDIYQLAVGMGQQAAENMDAGRWTIGDVAATVNKNYGTDMIGSFAKDIGVPVDRVREYRTVAGFWKKSARAEFSDLPLTYSHFRAAMGMGDIDDAKAMLHAAADGAWSVEKLRLAVRKAAGSDETVWQRVLDADAQITKVYGQEDGTYVVFRLDSQPPEELLQAYHDRRKVHVVGKTEYREEAKV